MPKGGKYKKGPGGAKMRVRKQKVKGQPMGQPATIEGKTHPIPNRPASLADLKQMHDMIMDDITRLLKELELKNRITVAKKMEEHSITKANQIVLQTMLRDKGILDPAEFRQRYDKYIEETQGTITSDGRMKGSTHIDMYRVGEKRVPTSTPEEYTGMGPVLIIQQ
jgi:hypothetical protein